MLFGVEKLIDFAMDITKLNLANLVGKVMDEIMEYLPKLYWTLPGLPAHLCQNVKTARSIFRYHILLSKCLCIAAKSP